MTQKEYLKMEDFFYGELFANDDEGIGSIIDADGEYVMQAMENSHMAQGSNKERNEQRKLIAIAAAHAITSHDELVAEVERLRGALQQCQIALLIADRFCGNHTSDDCGDDVAIPIRDALIAITSNLACFK